MTQKRRFIGDRKRPSNRTNIPSPNKPLSRSESVGLDKALSAFVLAKEAEQVRPATIRNYIDHVGYLMDYLTEEKGITRQKLSDLTAQVVRDYVHFLLYERVRYKDDKGRKGKTVGLSPHTVNMRLRTLRTMSRFWTSEGLTGEDFMANVKNVLTDEPDEIQGFSDAEVDLILSAFDTSQFSEYRDKTLVYLLLDTGLRINEAVSLTTSRVDFTMSTVFVPSQIAKNRHNREVPVSREVAKMLKELHEESVGYFGESETIFFNAYGEPFTADAFRKRLYRMRKRIGLDRLSPHMFRHTFGRNYLLNGGDIATLQRILDHADIETTRKYATVDNEDLKAQHNRYSPIIRILKRK